MPSLAVEQSSATLQIGTLSIELITGPFHQTKLEYASYCSMADSVLVYSTNNKDRLLFLGHTCRARVRCNAPTAVSAVQAAGQKEVGAVMEAAGFLLAEEGDRATATRLCDRRLCLSVHHCSVWRLRDAAG